MPHVRKLRHRLRNHFFPFQLPGSVTTIARGRAVAAPATPDAGADGGVGCHSDRCRTQHRCSSESAGKGASAAVEDCQLSHSLFRAVSRSRAFSEVSSLLASRTDTTTAKGRAMSTAEPSVAIGSRSVLRATARAPRLCAYPCAHVCEPASHVANACVAFAAARLRQVPLEVEAREVLR